MFESYEFLQHYWWFIISLLGGLLVFLLFVQGGQTLIYTIGKNEVERTMLVNTLGRKWEFTFTTLVTFGGAFFASFPLFYSTSFGGAYWVWMAILLAFVIQAVAYEYRTKPDNFLGKRTFEIFLWLNGALGTILLGTAVATFFTGSEFEVNKMNLTNIIGDVSPVISRWTGPAHGLEAVLCVHNVVLGLTVFFLARVLGLLYFQNTIDSEEIRARIKKQLWINGLPFVVLFLTFTIWLLLRDGFAVNPDTGEVFMEANKYLTNLLEMPLIAIVFVVGVLLVLLGLAGGLFKKDCDKAIWPAGVGTVLVVLSLFLIAGYNNTAYYPSKDLQSSLTIFNSSSSPYTLKVMSYVSLLVPFVLAYIIYAWRSINNKKIDQDEMENESHVY
ncbi:MAG: cytochrome d ubiquinol oxidase subunit II [Salinivirgaceae bacterium]|nr:MAG: cytochrome d ubiquinol oxidase subunit II [Salinivirgaceae bacterium]